MHSLASSSLVTFAVVVCAGLAIAMARVLSNATRFDEPVSRFASIDGLRGYAALAVFFHHAGSWYFYCTAGSVAFSPRSVYNMGRVAVTLFFMTTAFLFVEKVVFAKRPTDWLRMYVSRLNRMTPMYLFVIALMLFVVALRSSFVLNEPLAQVIAESARWVPFTAFGAGAVNGLKDTHMILSGATWTLPCEWFFYLLLPAIAIIFGRRAPLWLCVVTFAVALVLAAVNNMFSFSVAIFLPFIIGGGAVYVVRSTWHDRPILRNPWLLGAALLFCLAVNWDRVLWLSIAVAGGVFVLIVCGNSLNGLLLSRPARFLGQISYSVYLLHGLLLYCTFHWAVGMEVAANISIGMFWLTIAALTPVLLGLSTLTFLYIEKPAMQKTDGWTVYLRAKLTAQSI